MCEKNRNIVSCHPHLYDTVHDPVIDIHDFTCSMHVLRHFEIINANLYVCMCV